MQRGNYLTLAQPHVNIEMIVTVTSRLPFLGCSQKKESDVKTFQFISKLLYILEVMTFENESKVYV